MTRYARAIFCDDIREETNAKQSLIGVYNQSLYVNVLPASLPKLCAQVTVWTKKDRPLDKVGIEIQYNKQAIFTLPSSDDLLGKIDYNESTPDGFYCFTIQVIFSPIHLEEEGLITVRVTADGKKLNCNGLNIEKREMESD